MLKKKKIIWKLLSYAGISSILTYLVANSNTPEVIFNLDGSEASASQIKKNIVYSILLTFPALSFLLGLILAMTPYKKWTYLEKIVPAALLILISVEVWIILMKFF
tara:strand:+ start:15227 stop:15544 length:318 start_codon:yes stop_codon:yes gene_type:complete